jgi:hypothetical protein
MLHQSLEEFQIDQKLLAITADNASNNESLMSELYYNLASRLHDTNSSAGDPAPMRFQGGDSYIRCTAQVLNLIVNDILSALDAGDHKSAMAACDLFRQTKKSSRNPRWLDYASWPCGSQEHHNGSSSGS